MWSPVSMMPVYFIILLFFCPQILVAAGNLTQNSSRECAICHFRWIDQFVKGYGTELTPLETEDVAGNEMMCFSCHDGSTDDARTTIWLRDRHLTGMVPSDNVKIPKIFPLSHDGKMVCATCHSAHSVPTDSSIERTIFLRISSHDSQMCEMCHTDKGSKEFRNHPVHKGEQAIPPEIFAAGGVPSATNTKHLICESCHTAHGGLEHKNLLFSVNNSTLCSICHPEKNDNPRLPAREQKNHPLAVQLKIENPDETKIFTGPGHTLQCLSCHQVHSHEPRMEQEIAMGEKGQANRDVNKILRFPASDSSLCIVCHPAKNSPVGSAEKMKNHPLYKKLTAQIIDNNRLFAGVGQTLQCLSCHQIHQHAPGSKALMVERGALCATCHPEKQVVRGTDHNLTVTAPASLNLAGQNADQAGVCGACHVPHNASGRYLWARGNGTKESTLSGYCLNCHGRGGPAEKKMVGKNTHPVSVSVQDSQIQTLPLFTTRKGKKVMECSTCHDPHQWNSKDRHQGPGKNREGDCTSSFLRKPSGMDGALCRTCHSNKYRVEGTDHDLRITAPKDININRMTVTQAGVCGACHVAHNATGVFLWARPAGADVVTPSGLCLSCHLKQQIAAEKQVGEHSHPVDVPLSGTTQLPLYSKKDGTRTMVCHTCHDPHQWNSRFNIKGKGGREEGNEDTSFLRKTNRREPLLCRQCHAQQTLISGSDHDMRVTAPTSLNAMHKLPQDGSVCSPCHAVHNAPMKRKLWNAALADNGQDFTERVCYGCHQKNGAGQKKIVTSGSHPPKLYFGYRKSYQNLNKGSGGQTEAIPLYSHAGERTDAGEISCPTCHDPHVWYAGEKAIGPGKNREGTIVDSFLRTGARNDLCYACHGMTTLLLYRYYHNAEEKKAIRGKNLFRKKE